MNTLGGGRMLHMKVFRFRSTVMSVILYTEYHITGHSIDLDRILWFCDGPLFGFGLDGPI